MALLILIAALWVVVLAPGLVRRHTERRSVGSIDHFHHQLHLLERTGPKLVTPAYRLQSTESTTGVAVGASGYPAVTSMPGRPNLVLLKPVGQDEAQPDEMVDDAAGGHYRRIGPPELPPPPVVPEMMRLADPARQRRQLACKRRRDTLGLLVGTTMLTGLLSLVPSLHILWIAAVAGSVVLVAYLGLMVYARSVQGARVGAPRGLTRLPGHIAAASPARAGYPGAWDADDADADADALGSGPYDPVYDEGARAAAGR